MRFCSASDSSGWVIDTISTFSNLGWRILRVWSTDWFRNAVEAGDRLHKGLKELLEEDRARPVEVTATRVEVADGAPGGSFASDVVATDQEPAQLPDGSAGEQAGGLVDQDDGGEPTRKYAYKTAAPSATIEEKPGNLVRRSADPKPKYLPGEEPDLFTDERPDPERFDDDDYTPSLTSMISRIVADEGPIPLDLLARIVAREHGWQRTGRKIRERVLSCIGDNEIHDDPNGPFVWRPGTFADEIPFRYGMERGVRERPIAEFMGALRDNPGIVEADDSAGVFARRIGVQRLSADARRWLDECIALWWRRQ